MNKEKDIIETVKNVADNRENQIGSSLGVFLESLIEIQKEEKYRVTSTFAKRYEQIYKATKK
jgi:hypothetical protein